MKCIVFVLAASAILAAQPSEKVLPFDREVINRYSLDNLPRALSIRQGQDVWLGYDLGRATLRKVWQAPAGKPGLVTTGFATRSAGTALFEDKSAEKWQLRREGNVVPLTARYLGCSQREGGFELSWELRHADGVLKLVERIPVSTAPAAERVAREIRVESLAPDEVLLLPLPAREAWKLADNQGGKSAPALTGTEWHRLVLP
jgi:hypothetical protein